MKISLSITIIVLIFSAASIWPANSVANTDRAEYLIRRNLFNEDQELDITEAHFYQYGSAHVDGPSGGAMYRFRTTQRAVDWLVINFSLKEHNLISTDELYSNLSFDSGEKKPSWWEPEKVEAEKYYKLKQKLPHDELIILLYDKESGVIYFVKDYSGLRGV